MELFFLQAECGDATHIIYQGTDGQLHHIFVDTGYERTYDHVVSDRIGGIETIDLLVISHIHDDHIGGVIKYIRAIERKQTNDKVSKWCYNPPRVKITTSSVLSVISSAASIDQGDELLVYLDRYKKLPTEDFTTLSEPLELHGLKITWLSPSPEKLQRLRTKYADSSVPLEKAEASGISYVSGSSGNDYHMTIENFNLKIWIQDNNIENGSSIAFVCEANGLTVLFLADAHPSVIANSIENLGYTKDKRLKCDYVKVTHHGSKGNNSDQLYDLIDCRSYVISADGVNRHYLPSKESIARILRNAQRNINEDRYHFYFTYDNSVIRSIFDVDGIEVYKRWNFEVHYVPEGGKWLQLPNITTY